MRLATLKKRRDFVQANQTPYKVISRNVILQVVPPAFPADGDLPPIQYGLTVSRKVGKAVVRNKIRRRLRVILPPLLQEHGHPGCHYVWIARSAIPGIPFAELARECRWVLQKLTSLYPTLSKMECKL